MKIRKSNLIPSAARSGWIYMADFNCHAALKSTNRHPQFIYDVMGR